MSSIDVCRGGQTAPVFGRNTACFSVSASSDPSVMTRIVGIFAKRGMVPSQWNSRICGDAMDELQIDLQMDDMSAAETEIFAQSMRQIVCVERVLTSFKHSAENGQP